MEIDSDSNNLNVKSSEEGAAMQMDSSDSSAAQVIALTQSLFVCFGFFFFFFSRLFLHMLICLVAEKAKEKCVILHFQSVLFL